jgi:hypothetical protein
MENHFRILEESKGNDDMQSDIELATCGFVIVGFKLD